MNTRAQRKLHHTWILLVIAKQHLVQIGRINGPTEYSPYIFAAIKFRGLERDLIRRARGLTPPLKPRVIQM